MAKGGVRPGAGNPGYGKMKNLETNLEKFSPVFWALMDQFAKSKVKSDQRFFLQEFNKLQVRMVPQQLTGADGKDLFPVPILANANVPVNDSNQTNQPAQ